MESVRLVPGSRRSLVVMRAVGGAQVADVATAHALIALRSGPSATSGPGRLAGGALHAYAEDGLVEALSDAGFAVVELAAADIVLLRPTEKAVFLDAVPFDALNATNRVVTYLDLTVGEDERYRAAAEAVWADS